MAESKTAQGVETPTRVSKREYISRIARRTGQPVRTVSEVYEAGLAELMEIIINGDRLMLTGFGSFYPQEHKGHRVQFAGRAGEKVIDDYSVLKFSATRDVNRRLDEVAQE